MTAAEIALPALEELLPHRGAMLLLDRIITVSAERAVTEAVATPAWPGQEEGGAGALVLVELAAQTAGVCNGWERIQREGRDSNQMGWLVGIKSASFLVAVIPWGSRVVTTAENRFKYDKFREVFSTLRLGDEVCAEITLQLFQA